MRFSDIARESRNWLEIDRHRRSPTQSMVVHTLRIGDFKGDLSIMGILGTDDGKEKFFLTSIEKSISVYNVSGRIRI